ncbi:melatonin receptor type 1B-A-like [Asterias amurensis]|uniref:melatonin receptor type 1B-A-like n=1 Tax=Asterias amurensis TaxID=7602 RepID=UPI003AB82DD1
MNDTGITNATIMPTDDRSLYSYETRIGLACVWVLVSILGLVGNSLVIWSVILSKKLRTVTNTFVVQLGVADFWTCLSYPWVCVALLSKGTWPLESDVPCVIAAIQLHTGLGASLYTLASIALNRMVLITQPVSSYRWWYSPRKVAVMIAMTWVIPCIVTFLPPILGIGSIGYDPQDNTCSDKDGHPRASEYSLVQTVGLYPIPALIIICSYSSIYIHLKRHFIKQKKCRSVKMSKSATKIKGDRDAFVIMSFNIATCAESGRGAATNVNRNRKQIGREQLSITKNLFLVFCIFTLLQSPYFISLVIPSGQTFALYGVTIAAFNVCVNPVLYALHHPHFKVVVLKIAHCRYSEIPQPSRFLKTMLSFWNN